jgi:hypothetical protein
VRAVNRVAVRVVQEGSREAVAVRRVVKGAVRVAAANRAAARRVVGKEVRVAEAVKGQAEARGSDKVAGRASLVDVRVDRGVVRSKKLELSDS